MIIPIRLSHQDKTAAEAAVTQDFRCGGKLPHAFFLKQSRRQHNDAVVGSIPFHIGKCIKIDTRTLDNDKFFRLYKATVDKFRPVVIVFDDHQLVSPAQRYLESRHDERSQQTSLDRIGRKTNPMPTGALMIARGLAISAAREPATIGRRAIWCTMSGLRRA